MPPIQAIPRYARALDATHELLGKLRIDVMFVGTVARAAWLGGEIDAGAIDILALMSAAQRAQLAMMAANRGFRVEREELDQCEELDLVPLNFVDEEGEVRVHVLLATNALYARMFGSSWEEQFGERTLKVPAPEDLALMLLMSDDDEGVKALTALPEFNIQAFRERLASIGLGAATP